MRTADMGAASALAVVAVKRCPRAYQAAATMAKAAAAIFTLGETRTRRGGAGTIPGSGRGTGQIGAGRASTGASSDTSS